MTDSLIRYYLQGKSFAIAMLSTFTSLKPFDGTCVRTCSSKRDESYFPTVMVKILWESNLH